ncbi:hypothetical protein [Janthinobacterium sp. B9-8]|uniref:hypothetical protein n=1 Tax=Janthinobacterium sp. B9-8 TaxID=1236179 RepID=UPI00061D2D19|nr:hypothetical protein [Janthinobacterium sp. B9-8]AMC34268.1 hypothetical protein VN23_06480 [Janthinobacterium sp. B9-8]
MANNIYAEGIKSTGFILESRVGDRLRKTGWSIINNKYYEDDLEGVVREIDLLAYKVSDVKGTNIYTVLIISCKKDADNVWAFVAKKTAANNPNVNWEPLHIWSNNKAINYLIDSVGAEKKYHQDIKEFGVDEILKFPEYEVFAFQQMNRISGAAKNDKAIFGSVNSLIKAQSYEIGALHKRTKNICVYQFNLISVAETDLYRLDVDGDDIKQVKVDSTHYIYRYIINKKEDFSRVLFVSEGCFEKMLNEYSHLHKANCSLFERNIELFYVDIFKDDKKIKLFTPDFIHGIRWFIRSSLWRRNVSLDLEINEIHLNWNKSDECVEINVLFSSDEISILNNSDSVSRYTSKILREIYRYEGVFRYVEGIPF